MLIDRELNKLIHDLKKQKALSFTFAGSPMTLKIFDNGAKLALSAIVYEGGNYIPKSVRDSLSIKSQSYFPSIITTLSIDEEKFQISLNYCGPLQQLNEARFHHLLEEFNDLVGNWRIKLDERDRNDLIHVRIS